ncbi:Alpha/Beta hydrolase protein [Parachaetomium inaequale]|uniref:Alpha/Beta hydrolase protein n=1 Tax=Parachaetomium inaequale TaxID=2588326 RepID=A0AAN6PFA5_9PEZI|nr:Alpha/Beta hydrolase protein [Parachaetomium inaequale]
MASKDPANTPGELSVWDRVTLVGLFPLNPVLHWRQRLALAFLQAQRASFPTRHLRWLNRRVSTGEAILRHCDKHKIPHRTVTLDARTTSDRAAEASIPAPTLHFLTPPAAPDNESGPTLVYFHGGGFVNPLRGAAHMPFIMRCAGACRAKQVVVLEYVLSPEHPYPAQLVQCVATLRHLVDEMGLRPGDLVLAGDSAGGQLVGALLAHLVKPSPYAAPVKLNGKFRAALFVSPFVRLQEGVGSYETNDGKDYLNRSQVDKFMSAWKGNGEEIWADLCGASESGDVWRQVFARGSQGLVRKVMVTVGTADILLDSCRVFAKEHVQAETVLAGRDRDYKVFDGKDMVLAECDGEVHVQVALDSVVGYEKGSMERAIMSWLAGL